MVKNKFYKFTIIFTCLFLLISPFSVLADETDDSLINDDQQQEITDQSDYVPESNTTLIDTSDYATSDDIADLQSQIDDTNDDVEMLMPLLSSSLNTGNSGILTNFNKMSVTVLNFYYNNFNNILCFKDNLNGSFKFAYKDTNVSDIVISDDTLSFTTSDSYNISSLGDISSAGLSIFDFTLNNLSDSSNYGYTLFTINNFKYYSLTPYKLNVLNYGLGNYSNTITTEPYLSTNIYYSGQSISLTYDDSNNDFTGWYDNNGNLLSNDTTYTFNITSDTNLVINFNQTPVTTNDNTLLVLVCTLILFIFFMGGKVYD